MVVYLPQLQADRCIREENELIWAAMRVIRSGSPGIKA